MCVCVYVLLSRMQSAVATDVRPSLLLILLMLLFIHSFIYYYYCFLSIFSIVNNYNVENFVALFFFFAIGILEKHTEKK